MEKIGTHNSATGERGNGLLSFFGKPFAKCQSKTIREQYESGCRFFDLRAKKVNGTWRCAHGLWTTKRTLHDILNEINNFDDVCVVTLTYEGYCDEPYFIEFKAEAEDIFKKYDGIQFQYFAAKLPKWTIFEKIGKNYPIQGFKPIVGVRSLLPIPWLWHKISKKPTFNDKKFTLVDFL